MAFEQMIFESRLRITVQLKKVRTDTLSVGDAVISPVLSARNLGAYFDSNMTLVPFKNKYIEDETTTT